MIPPLNIRSLPFLEIQEELLMGPVTPTQIFERYPEPELKVFCGKLFTE